VDRKLVQKMLRPDAFNHPAGKLQLRETHISWVLLSGDFAYKIKKPVNFEFLDFSTLALRHHFCVQELQLNRRFSPALYLAVLPVTATEEGPQIDGGGEVVDYAVQMRRFDEAELLDNIAAHGGLDQSLVRALGRELARVHSELNPYAPDPSNRGPGTPSAMSDAMAQNFRQIRHYPILAPETLQLRQVEYWWLGKFEALQPILAQRMRQGYVIDGHGDAHLGNIALIDGAVRLFDCIEFNPAFRIMDSIGEAALLSMDMAARGYPEAANGFLSDYLEYSGDYGGLVLLDLYRCYFALVRVKVSLLSEAADLPGIGCLKAYQNGRCYLQLAAQYNRPPRPFVAITCGVSGSGKSTAAGTLVAHSGAVRIRSDVERKRLAGLAPEQRSAPAQKTLLYSSGMSQRTFDRLENLSREIINAGFAVIVDATFLHRQVRQRFADLARELDVPFIIIDCRVGETELRRRLTERERRGRDASDAGVAVMESQLSELEPLTGIERACAITNPASEDSTALWREVQRLCAS
jgi:aminoglycoside phosphotransferase family enzyme/predicted kinase